MDKTQEEARRIYKVKQKPQTKTLDTLTDLWEEKESLIKHQRRFNIEGSKCKDALLVTIKRVSQLTPH